MLHKEEVLSHLIKHLFKHPLFLSGFFFILLLTGASLAYSIFFDGAIPETQYMHDESGKMIDKSPFPPSTVPPLGTDQVGRHIINLLLQGAKFTIGIAVLVAGLRIIIGFVIGFSFNNILSRFHQWTSGLVNAFYYIPASLICYVLLDDVIMMKGDLGEAYTFFERATFELLILTAIAVPVTSLLIANQLRHIYQAEFIISARILGGSRLHILKKHIFPHLWPRLLIQFGQDVVQVLILLIHLGLFHLLFGGTVEIEPGASNRMTTYLSLSSEWSGMIGNAFEHLNHWPWLFLGPIIAFTLVILAFNLMIKGMEDVFSGQLRVNRKQRKNDEKKPAAELYQFDFVNKKSV